MSAIGDLFPDHGGCLEPVRHPGAVFFALNPDDAGTATAARVTHRLCAAHRLTDGPLAPGLLHVTLLLVGHFPMLSRRAVDAACDAAAAVDLRAFELTLDCAETFNTRRRKNPVVLVGRTHAAGVTSLRQALIAEMKRRGVPCGSMSRYTPHMTLLYDRRTIQEQPVEPVRWTVREFALIHSHYGYSRHVPLARWRLAE